MESLELTIKKHALLNAINHEGKAEAKFVISKIIGENPELRSKIKEVIQIVNSVVEEVNKLTLEEQRLE